MFPVILSLVVVVELVRSQPEICINPQTSSLQDATTHHYLAASARSAYQDGAPVPGQLNQTVEKHSTLGLGEISCLHFEDLNIKLKVELVAYKEVYPVKERYNFSVPTLEVECYCDCPGGMDHCSSAPPDSCPGPSCGFLFQPHQSPAGCSVALAGWRAQMCCTAAPRSSSSSTDIPRNNFTAIKLGSPRLEVVISQKRYQVDADTELLVAEEYQVVDLNRHHLLDTGHYIMLHLDVNRVTPMLHPGWYFTHGGRVYGGSQLNGRDEWDVGKLGWYKTQAEQHFAVSQLATSMSGSVVNCPQQKMNFELGAKYTTTFPVDAYEIFSDHLEPQGADYEVTAERVVVSRSHSPRLDMAMTFVNTTRSIHFTRSSSFKRFEGEILETQEGHVYLVLTLHEAQGTFEGKYISNTQTGEVEPFLVYLPRKVVMLTKHIPLVDLCSEDRAKVCLRTIAFPSSKYNCKTIFCDRQNTRFYPKPMEIKTFLPLKLSKWTIYLTPSEWGNGINSTLEGVVRFVVIILSVIFIYLILKLGLKLLGTRNM